MTDVHCPVCHVIIPKAGSAGEDSMCPLCHAWILAVAGYEEVLYISQAHQV